MNYSHSRKERCDSPDFSAEVMGNAGTGGAEQLSGRGELTVHVDWKYRQL